MKQITALLIALGLALPAIASAQEDRPPRRDGDGPRGREFREPGFAGPMRDGGGPRREFYRGERRGPGPMGMRGRGMGFRGGQPPHPPLIGLLDRNHDGVLDEREIDQAPRALRQLDRNGDGDVTIEELRPGGRGFGPGRGPADLRDRRDGDRGPGEMRGPRYQERPRGEFRERREEVRRDGEERRDDERREVRRERERDRDAAEREKKDEAKPPREKE